jgi:hypothetical protein
MRTVASHTIEKSVIVAKNRISIDFIDNRLDDLAERPDALPTMYRRCLQLAAGYCATGAGERGPAALRLSARTAALMFVHAHHANESTFILLDEKTPVELAGTIDESLVNAPAWVDSMWCALAAGDGLAQEWLSTVAPTDLVPAGVRHGRYVFALGECLRSLVTQDGRHGEWLVKATGQCDAAADPTLEPVLDWVDDIDFPSLRALFHALEGDGPNFNAALVDVLEGHRRYWSSAENALAIDGLLSMRACALCRLAAALGVEIEIASDYMPPVIWRAETAHPLRCPYCVGPLPEGAPACGLCGSALKDAPLEITRPSPRSEHAPCVTCAYPLHRFATLCPACRTPRRMR